MRRIWSVALAFLALASGASASETVPFQAGLLAALSRQGCSAGACHGSPTGKGGFRLSLRGFDPALDEQTLVREDLGRRVNVHDPESSLILLKPTMQVSHGGGQKLRKSDPSYAIIRDWISQGAQADAAGTPACEVIEVTPPAAELRHPVWQQALQVAGRFSDGTTRDLTHLAVFSSSDETVATVSADGLVTGQGRGEATILVRYLEHIATVPLVFHQEVPGFVWNEPPENNFIDRPVFAKLKKLQLGPAELSSDHEFIRRVYLDVLGILPPRADVEAFISNPLPEKRNELIDALLDRPEYAERMAQRWADLLRVKSGKLGAPAAHKLHRWLAAAMDRNMKYDELARTLLTAEGSTLANPPANFFRAAAEANDCAEATAQLFLAARIQCAKCHNHPFDRWSQNEYHALGAFFARVGRRATSQDGEMLIFTATTGETIQPRTGKAIAPAVPISSGKPAALATDDADRRQALAAWLASPENRLFAKVGANRTWGWLLGRGIVEPVDDLRDSNPPCNSELLEALTDDFIESGFDQKRLVRTILRSRTYQLSSRTSNLSDKHTKYFAVYPARVLPAEQLLDAISTATGVPNDFPNLPAGTRAGELPSPELGGHFLWIFGQPGRDTVCDCERGKEPKLTQPLTLLNGGPIGEKLRDPRSKLSVHLAKASAGEDQATVDRAFVGEIYWAALSRPATDEELAIVMQHVAQAANRRDALEDVCWALLNAKEFLFQH